MYLTRNQAWARVHRGFESHPLRQYYIKTLAIYCGGFVFSGESTHACGWDSKGWACKPNRGLRDVGESHPLRQYYIKTLAIYCEGFFIAGFFLLSMPITAESQSHS